MKKSTRYIIIGSIYAALIISFIGLAIFVKTASNKKQLITNIITNPEDADECDDPVVFTIEVVKFWDEQTDKDHFGPHKGVQYDAVIINNTSYDISNWVASFSLPTQTTIDSSWNGNYDAVDADGKFTVTVTATNTPQLDNHIITGKNSAPFGMVVHLRIIPEQVTDFSLYGVYAYKMTDFPLFWVLVVISLLVLFLSLVQIAVDINLHKYNVQKMHDETLIMQAINTFVNFIDAKDPYTKGHSARVAVYSRELAKRMNLSEEDQKSLYIIALMHDVGKISIPDSILQKPGKLTPEERKVIESHTTVGGTMLRDFNALPGIVSGALYHHERYDGTGYPQGIAGTDIPLFARIICVADSYDAMSSRRCYRAKLSLEEIIRELTVNSGKQFDPEIVKHMLDMLDEAKDTGRLAHYNL